MNPDWCEIWEAFHATWGKSAKGVYDKKAWMLLQELLQRLADKANSGGQSN